MRESHARTYGWPLLLTIMIGAAITLWLIGCGTGDRVLAIALPPLPPVDPTASRSGGDTTVNDATGDAFALPVRDLDKHQRRAFAVGNAFFNDKWVPAPASTIGRVGLGPLFNSTSCSACHFKDGRGRPPDPAAAAAPLESMLVRLSVPPAVPPSAPSLTPNQGPTTPASEDHGAPRDEPVYGGQFQEHGILGVPPEGRVVITYKELPGRYADGETYTLRQPTITLTQLRYGPLSPQVMLSGRVAQAVFGLGLLEAIPEADVLARADPDDRDGDGVRGRPNRVWDVRRQQLALGRFGWKAGQPTVEQQVAAAFNGDIGITSVLFPTDSSTVAQTLARAAPNGGEPELSEHKLQRVTQYCRTLAVPARRQVEDLQVRRGEQLFNALRCDTCHTPTQRTGKVPDLTVLSEQTIRPYTDLLLHDLGEGLADHRPEFAAGGRDWRTAPLWGLGLIQTVNQHELLLHDGRARGVAEAILWHGGEAEPSKEAFRRLPQNERAALIRFLRSL